MLSSHLDHLCKAGDGSVAIWAFDCLLLGSLILAPHVQCCFNPAICSCEISGLQESGMLQESGDSDEMIRFAPAPSLTASRTLPWAVLRAPRSPLRSRQTTSTPRCRCVLHNDHRTLPLWPPRVPRAARSPYPLVPPGAPPRQTKAILTCSASPMHPLSPTRWQVSHA